MKRRILVLVGTILLLVLAACAGNSSSDTPASDPNSSASGEIQSNDEAEAADTLSSAPKFARNYMFYTGAGAQYDLAIDPDGSFSGSIQHPLDESPVLFSGQFSAPEKVERLHLHNGGGTGPR